MEMKGIQAFTGKKAAAVFLIVCLMGFLLPGVTSPNVAKAANGESKIVMGIYRGLKQEVTVPVKITNPSGVAALTFSFQVDPALTIKSISPGTGLRQVAEFFPYIEPKNKKDANVGIYSKEGLNSDMVLVNIVLTHNLSEGAAPCNLTINGITAYDADGGDMSKVFKSENGYVDVKVMYGDMNRSESVTITDVQWAMNAVTGGLPLSSALLDVGNVSRDPGTPGNSLTIYDIFLIAQYAAGEIEYFPVNVPSSALPTVPVSGKVVAPNFLNITGDNFKVKFPEKVFGWVKLSIEDTSGKVLKESTETINNNDMINIGFDANLINNGIDTLKITQLTQDLTNESKPLEFPGIAVISGADYPIISAKPPATISVGAASASIIISLEGSDTFDDTTNVLGTIEAEDGNNWNFNNLAAVGLALDTTSGTGITLDSGKKFVTIDLSGSAVAGTFKIWANKEAVKNSLLSTNCIEIEVK